MYVNRLELGDMQQAPSATLPTGLAVERFSNHRRPLHLGWIIAFLVGSLFGILRTVPNRFLSGIGTCYVELFRNVPLIVQFFTRYWWCQSSCRKISACGLNRSWTQTFNSLSPPCCAGAVYRRSRLRAGTRRHPAAAARAEERRPAMGLTLPQTYRYVLLPNAYRVIVPPMTSEMMNR